MSNRMTTLVDLDALLGGARTPSTSGAVAKTKGVGRRGARSCRHAPDKGAPISLQYGDAVARVVASSTQMSAAQMVPPWAFQTGAYVESFDEEDTPEESADEVEDPSESPSESLAPNAAAPEPYPVEDPSYVEPPESDQRDDMPFSRQVGSSSGPRARSPYADQLAAFESEMQSLSSQQKAAQAATPPIMPEDREPSDDIAPVSRMGGGHAVFDDMSKSMEFANEFRLPPVQLSQVFAELDSAIEGEQQTAARGQKPMTAPVQPPVAPLPDDAFLEDDLRVMAPQASAPVTAEMSLVAEQFGSGELRHFTPEEILFDDDDAKAVIAFFWPNRSEFGQVTEKDREFAQAMLIEAADASHSMRIVESLYRTFYGKVATSFKDVRKMLIKIAKKAIEDGWFVKIKTVEDAEKQEIYESVRASLARNQRSVWEIRVQTGELTW